MSEQISLHHTLPRFKAFLQRMAADYHRGKFNGWTDFRDRCMAFYTPQTMDSIDRVVRGWKKMSGYADAMTLVHVTAALVALMLNDDYRSATPHQQRLMEWIVVFHDIDKQARVGKRDLTHGFRSGAVTARALPALGFPVKPHTSAQFEAWADITNNAAIFDDTHQEIIQDNRWLPDIMRGIDDLFAGDSRLIIKGVLLHMSLDNNEDWPTEAPLSDDEIKRYISPELLPLLRAMIYVDNDAWSLFSPETKARYRGFNRKAFDHVEALVLNNQAMTGN